MKVLKFGGTSVGSAERIRHVAGLIGGSEPKVVVLSTPWWSLPVASTATAGRRRRILSATWR